MAMSKIMRATLRAISKHDINVKENYENTRKFFDAAHPPLAGDYQLWNIKIVCGDHEIPVRIFAPEDTRPQHVIVYFHGGGWSTGNIESYTNVCSRLARNTNSYVVSVDYRLAPEHPFPAGPEDCYCAAKAVFEQVDVFGLPKEKIVLMGDSAGGNLAAVVSLMARDRGEFLPAKQILIYPATYNDHSPNSPFRSIEENGYNYLLTSKRIRDYLTMYTGDKAEVKNNPYFAPLLADSLANQPITLILTAQYCPLRDEGEAYGRRLIAEGNKASIHCIPDAIHGYFSLPPQFKPVKQSYAIINSFLNEV